jgi:hypothetical protein
VGCGGGGREREVATIGAEADGQGGG